MMPGMEFSKIFAALLIAGCVAIFGGTVASALVHVDTPDKPGFPVDASGAGAAVAAAPKGPEPILGLIAAANVEQGKKLAKACAACHTLDKGGPNRVGPNLWGVVNRPKGKHEGFSYSSAMAEKGGSWSYADLNHFLYKPKDYVPGTKMTFAGFKKTEDRAAVIAFLRSLADSTPALPSQGEIEAEKASMEGAATPPAAAVVPAAASAPAASSVPVPAVPVAPAAPAPGAAPVIPPSPAAEKPAETPAAP